MAIRWVRFMVAIFSTFMKTLSAASYKNVVANSDRTSDQAITRISELLRRALARKATSCCHAAIIILGDSNGSFTNEDQAFVSRCSGQRLLATSYAINGFFYTEVFTSLDVCGRFSFQRRFIGRTSDYFRMSTYVTTGISGRTFAFLIIRLHWDVRGFRVTNASRLACFSVASFIVWRVDDISDILEGISTYSYGAWWIFFSRTFRPWLRLEAFQSL